MKSSIFIIFILIFINIQLQASSLQEIKVHLNQFLHEIDKSKKIKACSNLLSSVQIYINTADKNNIGTPSDDRLKRISLVSEVLSEYAQNFVNTGIPTLDDPGIPNSLTLLYYCKSNRRTQEVLFNAIQNMAPTTQGQYAKVIILRVIFDMGLESEEIKDYIISKAGLYNESLYTNNIDEVEKSEIAYLVQFICETGMVEALPIYQNLLENNFMSNDEKFQMLPKILQALNQLGPSAKNLLPVLEKYRIDISKDETQINLQEELDLSINILSENKPPQLKYSITGRGQIKKSESIITLQETKPTLSNKPHSKNIIDIESAPPVDLIFGVTKRNLLSALMIAGGGALLVMTLLYAFWPRQK